MDKNRVGASLVMGWLLVCGSAFGASDDSGQVKGMIVSRTGETLLVKGGSDKTTVVLTAETRTKDDTGLFGLSTDELADTVLMPGLKVKVDGVSDNQGRVVAKTITVDGDDLETAEMIQAGLHPTAQQVAANVQAIEKNRSGVTANRANIEANAENIASNKENVASNKQAISANRESIETHTQQIEQNLKDIQENSDRFSQLSEYDVKASATVKFKVGSSQISEEDLEKVKELANATTRITGYIVEVKGFADSTGDARMNEKLSEDRAKAVVSYLIQQCNVPVFHIVAPAAMGEFQPAATNETEEGRADNRRVEVRVLVNRGIAGK